MSESYQNLSKEQKEKRQYLHERYKNPSKDQKKVGGVKKRKNYERKKMLHNN